MIQKTVYIEYREAGVLTNVFQAVLAAENLSLGGVIVTGTGAEVYPTGTTVDNPSTGRYEKVLNLEEGVAYTVFWKLIVDSGGEPKYASEQIGPFTSSPNIRAVGDRRGTFIQGTRGTVFLRVTDNNGQARDPGTVTCTVYDPNNAVVVSGTPERAAMGFYAFDWDIGDNQATGTYTVVWSYNVDEPSTVTQEVVVTRRSESNPPSLYAARILEFRISIEFMITCAQNIPVYSEPAKASADRETFMFSFGRWNQTPSCRIYLNDEIVTSGIEVNYFKGTVTFDEPLTSYDRIRADYNFRWFSDEELDRFLSNAVNLVNLWPPVDRGVSLMNIQDRFIPLVLYGAAVDAIRHMMMCLQFQQPQMVFGGPEGAKNAYSNLEGLKKNYEDTWNKGLEQKKNGPYAGLTRTLVTPEFALPGGRSRWFRYLFSSGA